ncbi:MFS transporter, CP family, cyanate transporter [Brevibacterium aurantiacum]|uniref:MFS transporter, CP family, cyanate transporter n=1 Tax=Brevibacterium aurantiacum TaxID=273384 RepID=A0A2H1JIX9_BREAU|nr:MFS transporter [Brevibacterium aurantiacum]SMX87475.1 MFS transporter, CP family, cyanate transporter [Brevibacterium aurantiacum]
MNQPDPSVARRMLPWMVVGIVVLAINLRAPIIAPTAVLGDIQDDTGLSAAGVGLLTGLPVLLFALVTPVAGKAIGRFGAEAAVLSCLTGVLLGTVLRSLGPPWLVLVGTGIIGFAITLGNIAVPVIIRREVPWSQVSMVTGLYSATMNVGSMITLLGTGPLAAAVGWRWAVAIWGGMAVLGLAYWLFAIRLRIRRNAIVAAAAETPPTPAPTPERRPWREAPPEFRAIIALLVVTFSGQSIAYYTTTTWLPSILADTGGLSATASGGTASLFQIAAILGAFGVPLLAARTKPWVPVAIIAALWLSLPVGLLLAPSSFVLWSITGGIAQGGGFTAIFSIIARTAGSDRETASASARVQGGGYLTATLAPPFAGWLGNVTDGWTAPILLILAATLAFTITGLLAVRISGRFRGGGPATRREVLDE